MPKKHFPSHFLTLLPSSAIYERVFLPSKAPRCPARGPSRIELPRGQSEPESSQLNPECQEDLTYRMLSATEPVLSVAFVSCSLSSSHHSTIRPPSWRPTKAAARLLGVRVGWRSLEPEWIRVEGKAGGHLGEAPACAPASEICDR